MPDLTWFERFKLGNSDTAASCGAVLGRWGEHDTNAHQLDPSLAKRQEQACSHFYPID